jgi:CRISPR system Cascade subunit CasD
MVAAAMGIRRDDKRGIERIVSLRFGIRIDQYGSLLNDYHAAKKEFLWEKIRQHTVTSDDLAKGSYITHRYYLSDAVFLVGLEGDATLLTEIDQALHAPFFPLFLGRRSCPPEGRLCLGIRPAPLLEALKEEPWQVSEYMKRKASVDVRLPVFTDADDGDEGSFYQRDVPISFSQEHREFGFRRVVERDAVILENTASRRYLIPTATEHDAMAAIEISEPDVVGRTTEEGA